MERKIGAYIQKLARTKTGDELFNPYNELHTDVDDRTAPGVRQQNLRLYLNTHAKLKNRYLWVYGAPSYSRATRSGIPLLNSTMFDQAESSLDTSRRFERTIKRRKTSKSTVMSTTLWDVAEELGVTPLIWPTIPFYSHKKGKLMSRRYITDDELAEYRWFLERIIEMYKPKKILAIGREAERALKLYGIKYCYVQHPRSGKKAFKKRVANLMS